MKSYTVEEYKKAGCQEMNGGMLVVHGMTDGKVCDTGCARFEEGKCVAYKKLIGTSPASPSSSSYEAVPVETVKQEASRRGISISEVRRQRTQSRYSNNDNQ